MDIKIRGKGGTKKCRLSRARHIVCIHSLVLFSLTPGKLVFMFQDWMIPLAKAVGAERGRTKKLIERIHYHLIIINEESLLDEDEVCPSAPRHAIS